MELTDFLTQSFITSFSGTLVSVELIVFVTKELPILKKIPTRIYTFVLALAHLIIVKATASTIQLNVQSCYLLLLNAMVIAVILCGGYDTIMTNIKGFVDNEVGKVNELNNEVTTVNSLPSGDDSQAKETKITVPTSNDSQDKNNKESTS